MLQRYASGWRVVALWWWWGVGLPQDGHDIAKQVLGGLDDAEWLRTKPNRVATTRWGSWHDAVAQCVLPNYHEQLFVLMALGLQQGWLTNDGGQGKSSVLTNLKEKDVKDFCKKKEETSPPRPARRRSRRSGTHARTLAMSAPRRSAIRRSTSTCGSSAMGAPPFASGMATSLHMCGTIARRRSFGWRWLSKARLHLCCFRVVASSLVFHRLACVKPRSIHGVTWPALLAQVCRL